MNPNMLTARRQATIPLLTMSHFLQLSRVVSSYMSNERAAHIPYQGTHLREETKPVDSFCVSTTTHSDYSFPLLRLMFK